MSARKLRQAAAGVSRKMRRIRSPPRQARHAAAEIQIPRRSVRRAQRRHQTCQLEGALATRAEALAWIAREFSP
jgi:hypothetical protein